MVVGSRPTLMVLHCSVPLRVIFTLGNYTVQLHFYIGKHFVLCFCFPNNLYVILFFWKVCTITCKLLVLISMPSCGVSRAVGLLVGPPIGQGWNPLKARKMFWDCPLHLYLLSHSSRPTSRLTNVQWLYAVGRKIRWWRRGLATCNVCWTKQVICHFRFIPMMIPKITVVLCGKVGNF